MTKSIFFCDILITHFFFNRNQFCFIILKSFYFKENVIIDSGTTKLICPIWVTEHYTLIPIMQTNIFISL